MKRQDELNIIVPEVEKTDNHTLVIAKDITIFIIINFLYFNFKQALIIAI